MVGNNRRGVVCAIFTCNNYRVRTQRNRSFYRFPRNKEICKQWVMRSGRVDLEQIFRTNGPEHLNRGYFVCSDHFVHKDFKDKNISKGIHAGSVPSVFVDIKENNSRPSPKKTRETEVEQKESVHDIQMLEVPGHHQKPHEIFISEQADWSSENSALDETDPLCLEEDQIPSSPVTASDMTQQVVLFAPAFHRNAPVSESVATAGEEPSMTKSYTGDTGPGNPVTGVDSAAASPVQKAGVDAVESIDLQSGATAEEEPSTPKGYAGDTGPGSSGTGIDSPAASPVQKAGGDAVESIDPRVLCPSHGWKKISYLQMITMAIMDSPDWQISAREIFRYTACNFPWVRSRGNWCQSIRCTLYSSPLFAKARDAAARNWTVVPPYAGMLRRLAGRACCRWELIRWLRMRVRRGRAGTPPRGHECRPHCGRCACCSPLSAAGVRKSTPSTETADKRSPLSCRASVPPTNCRRESLQCQTVSESAVENPKVSVGSAPPLEPTIQRAFVHSACSKSTPSSETADNRSPLSCRASVPPPNRRRESLQCQSVSKSAVENPKMSVGSAPPLEPIIQRAFLHSPYRHVPLSEIYAYCIIHWPYYRNRRKQCYWMIKRILDREECFQRVPQPGSRAHYWMFDGQLKDWSENQSAASGNPREHVCGPRPERSAEVAGAEGVHSRLSRLADTAPQLGSDTGVSWRLRGTPRSYPARTRRGGGGASCGDRPTPSIAVNRCGFGSKQPRVYRPHLESLHRYHKSHSDYLSPVKPVEVSDEMDIKEEPFPEEPPMENSCIEENGYGRQSVCSTLPDVGCCGNIKIKQEKEEYCDTVKHELVDTW